MFGLSNEKDSDAYNNNDTESEKQEAMERNQAKLDATENWRLTNDGIEVKGQNGFVPVSKLSVAQLQVIVKMKKFEGIRADLERELASR